MKKAVITIFVILLILAYAIRKQPNLKPTQKNVKSVTIGLGYIENIQFAPFYVALEEGYFLDQGIDKVQLIHGISPDLIVNVGAGKFDFAMSDGDEIIKAQSKAEPIPVEPVFTFYKKFPIVLTSLKDTKLDSLQDLVGRSTGIPGEYGASYDGFLLALKKENIERSSLDLKSIGYTQIEHLLNKQVDVVVVFSNNEIVKLKQMGKEVNVLPLSNYTDLISATLVTNSKKLETDPGTVQGVKSALAKGMKFCSENPEKALAISFDKGYIPAVSPEERQYNLEVLKESIKLWGDINQVGLMDDRLWEKSKQELMDAGII